MNGNEVYTKNGFINKSKEICKNYKQIRQ